MGLLSFNEPMPLSFESTVVDCNDAKRVGEFWAALLDRPLESDADGTEHWIDFGPEGRDLLFLTVPEPKTVKNRLHIDLRPDDQDAEVERALALGASHVDIGQGDQTWVVLADPEGNEFCVLRALPLGEA
jgi:predicted enzyme related to lactoylglutathione lyase